MRLATAYAAGAALVVVATAWAPAWWTFAGLALAALVVALPAPRRLQRRMAPLVLGLVALAILAAAPVAARLL